jgi:branched-chain amino acid transport system permease protein
MFAFLIAGLVLGSIYAIAAAGLVVTYSSSGILNFAYGAQAYFVARMFYFLHTQHGWSIFPAAVVCILGVGPAMGALLWLTVFRLLRTASTLVRIVTTIGLSVAIPPVAVLLFGNVQANTVPGLAPTPVHIWHLWGAAITLDQVIVLGSLVVIAVVGALVLRFTDVGLTVRALVESEALTSISGTNPTVTSIGVWSVTSFLAGLAGVLVAPIIGLTDTNFTLLVAAAFAAVIVARLRHIGLAVLGGLVLGLLGGVVERYVPPGSSWATAATSSIPFAVVFVALLWYVSRGEAGESGSVGGFLDHAIAVGGADLVPEGDHAHAAGSGTAGAVVRGWLARRGGVLVVFVVVAILPLVLHGVWVGLLGQGAALGIIFLSYSLLAGEGGMVWLCQVTFAGVGALATAELATNAGWPVLAAVIAGGLIAVPMGVVIALLTARLGDLYVALVTLTFAVLMDNLVFSLNLFYQFGQGIALNAPSFASSPRVLSYVALAAFALIALLLVNVRSSTTGLVLAAVRWSSPAAQTLGISVRETKVLVSALAAFIAAVGGGLLAIFADAAITTNYNTIIGLAWLAVLVTVGIRSNVAALVAGMAFAFIPAVFSTYAPTSVLVVPTALFGLGAVLVARNPDGTVATVLVRGRLLARRTGGRRRVLPHDGAGDVVGSGPFLATPPERPAMEVRSGQKGGQP